MQRVNNTASAVFVITERQHNAGQWWETRTSNMTVISKQASCHALYTKQLLSCKSTVQLQAADYLTSKIYTCLGQRCTGPHETSTICDGVNGSNCMDCTMAANCYSCYRWKTSTHNSIPPQGHNLRCYHKGYLLFTSWLTKTINFHIKPD